MPSAQDEATITSHITMGGVHVSIQLSSLDSRVGLFRRACVQQRHHADDPIALNHWRWHYD
jgi:hypothetical protein